jgi:hypothetical protein
VQNPASTNTLRRRQIKRHPHSPRHARLHESHTVSRPHASLRSSLRFPLACFGRRSLAILIHDRPQRVHILGRCVRVSKLRFDTQQSLPVITRHILVRQGYKSIKNERRLPVDVRPDERHVQVVFDRVGRRLHTPCDNLVGVYIAVRNAAARTARSSTSAWIW